MTQAERRVLLLVAALLADGLGRVIELTPAWVMRRQERDALTERLKGLRKALDHVHDKDPP